MRKLVKAFSVAAFGLAVSSAAFAESPPILDAESVAPAVQVSTKSSLDASTFPSVMNVVTQSGLTVKDRFDAAGGLTGWLIATPTGSTSIVYTPPSGDVLIAGSLVTIDGEDLTSSYMEKLVNYDEFFEKLDSVDSIAVSPPDVEVSSTIYAFLDTSCVFCNYLYKALGPYVEKGLEVKWIPVGILGPNSSGQAAAIMASADRAAALHEHETTWNVNGSKGIEAIALTPEMQKELDANSQLLSDLGGSGTPLIVYKNAAGSWQKVAGMPRLSELPEITGLPEQIINDPSLERFR